MKSLNELLEKLSQNAIIHKFDYRGWDKKPNPMIPGGIDHGYQIDDNENRHHWSQGFTLQEALKKYLNED